MNSTDVLAIAAKMTTEQTAKAAHALGWPHPRDRHWGHVKWRNPWRNHYCGPTTCPDWGALRDLGLARLVAEKDDGWVDAIWCVTPLGQAAVRARLRAVRDARELS